ncbi:MAG: response regulator transcription factor [Dehalococcoidia bacterium]
MQSGAAIMQGLSPESALVVDGDQDYVKAIRAALVDDVASIDAVSSIAGAVTRLQGQSHRLVIIDSALGGDPTAIDLVRALRRTRPEVAIVMTSSSSLTATQVAACFEAGADEFIRKPFHPQEFAARVRAVNRRVRRSLAASAAAERELKATA